MKRKLALFMSLFVLFSVFAIPVMAEEKISLQINGNVIESAIAPIQENGTTLVPLKVVSESLGARIDWNGETKTITITKENRIIQLTLNQTAATVDGKAIELSMAPRAENGTTMVPIRFISENLDCEIDWNGDTRTVVIQNKNVQPQEETPLDEADDLAGLELEDLAELDLSGKIFVLPADKVHSLLNYVVDYTFKGTPLSVENVNDSQPGNGTYYYKIDEISHIIIKEDVKEKRTLSIQIVGDFNEITEEHIDSAVENVSYYIISAIAISDPNHLIEICEQLAIDEIPDGTTVYQKENLRYSLINVDGTLGIIIEMDKK